MTKGENMCKTVCFEIYVKQEDVGMVIKKMLEVIDGRRVEISTGNCGWANAMDCCWIRLKLTIEERIEIVDWICEEEVFTYNPSLIY